MQLLATIAGMTGIAPAAQANQLLRFTIRPLGLPQFALASAIVVLATTFYCQVYCLIAFQPLHPRTMPLSASLAWAIGAVMPWLACLELAKRPYRWARSPLGRSIAILCLFGAAAALSIILELRPRSAGRSPCNAPDANADRGAASGSRVDCRFAVARRAHRLRTGGEPATRRAGCGDPGDGGNHRLDRGGRQLRRGPYRRRSHPPSGDHARA